MVIQIPKPTNPCCSVCGISNVPLTTCLQCELYYTCSEHKEKIHLWPHTLDCKTLCSKYDEYCKNLEESGDVELSGDELQVELSNNFPELDDDISMVNNDATKAARAMWSRWGNREHLLNRCKNILFDFDEKYLGQLSCGFAKVAYERGLVNELSVVDLLGILLFIKDSGGFCQRYLETNLLRKQSYCKHRRMPGQYWSPERQWYTDCDILEKDPDGAYAFREISKYPPDIMWEPVTHAGNDQFRQFIWLLPQLLLKLRAVANLRSLKMIGEAVSRGRMPLPAELVNLVIEAATDNIVANSPILMQAIRCGQDLSPHIQKLEIHAETLLYEYFRSTSKEMPLAIMGLRVPIMKELDVGGHWGDRITLNLSLKSFEAIPGAVDWVCKSLTRRNHLFRRAYHHQDLNAIADLLKIRRRFLNLKNPAHTEIENRRVAPWRVSKNNFQRKDEGPQEFPTAYRFRRQSVHDPYPEPLYPSEEICDCFFGKNSRRLSLLSFHPKTTDLLQSAGKYWNRPSWAEDNLRSLRGPSKTADDIKMSIAVANYTFLYEEDVWDKTGSCHMHRHYGSDSDVVKKAWDGNEFPEIDDIYGGSALVPGSWHDDPYRERRIARVVFRD